MNLTTKQLELAVISYEKQAELKSVRTSLPWECDVLTVSKSRYATEWEIKRSRSDFKSDFKKPKHIKFKRGQGGHIKYFWFVVPKGLVRESEVPSYAGLMYVNDEMVCSIVRRPKRLKCKKIGDATMRKLYRSMMFRFLKLNFDGMKTNFLF